MSPLATRLHVRMAGLCAVWLAEIVPLTTCAQAQVAQAQNAQAQGLRASLVTFGPGDAAYEKFGHNAIWLHDPSQPQRWQDVAFHYGLFEFDVAFPFRFVQKELRYSMGAFDYPRTLAAYQQDNRSIRVQELNLSPAELESLRRFLHWNVRQENAQYDYDYYRDNCSTRVRDVLDRAVRGQIQAQSAAISSRTYRTESRRLLQRDLVAYTALDFMLGPAGERPLSQWELMFLPEVLADHLSQVNLKDAAGNLRPMLLDDTVPFASSRKPLPGASPQWTLRYLLLGLILAGGMLALSLLECRRLIAVSLVGWSLFAGLAGSILVYFVLFTAHEVAAGNLNFLHASPLSLVLALWVPRLFRRERGSFYRAEVLAWTICAISAGAAITACALPQYLPQQNGPFVAWLLPVNAAVAIILRRASQGVVCKPERQPT